MAGASKKRSGRRNPVDKLTDDLLLEILSRVPYKSLCRFKCVSRRWCGIISHPDHRKALPRYHLETLAGFFYTSYNEDRFPGLIRHFTNVSGVGRPLIHPSLSFLPKCEYFHILDSCNGLLLCRCWKPTDPETFDYVVCSPATEKWVVLPDSDLSSKVLNARLGFDPAVSSHFHVFECVEDWGGYGDEDEDEDEDEDGDRHVKGLEIYSSKTGVWSHKDNGWSFEIRILDNSKSVFFNGMLHLITIESVLAAVDVEGDTWRIIRMPHTEEIPFLDIDAGFIDVSQGQLYFANTNDYDANKLSIWVLEDYGCDEWILKHTVSNLHLFGMNSVHFRCNYIVVSIHPECNMIFLVFGLDRTLISYEMDSGEVHFICDLGLDCQTTYLPYVPLFSESLADGH